MRFHSVSTQGTLIESSTIYESSRFDICMEKHRLSNESVHDFIIVDAPNWVSVIPVDEKGNFIMVWQYRAAWRRASLEFPAGKLNFKDEDYLKAAQRELREETGYLAKNWELLGMTRPVTWTTQEVGIFLANDLKYDIPDPDPEEDIEVVTINPNKF